MHYRSRSRSLSSLRGTRQRGAILMQVTAALLVCIIALTGTELGYLFFVKREMQKSVDLAALAGARQLATSTCTAGNAAAVANANQNLSSLGFPLTVTPSCGRWDPANDPNNRYFQAGAGQPNAVEVFVSGTGPALLPFLGNRLVSARALAKAGPPLAGFSVGSKLVSVTGNGLLGDSLKLLGLDLTGTSLVGYDGLANVKITPGGLLQELGIPVGAGVTVGDLNALLAANQVSLGQVLDATARLASRNDLLAANLTLANRLTTILGASLNPIKLGSDASGTGRGLFASVVSPDTSAASALDVQVRALDIVNTAIGVATAGHAVNLSTGVNLLGLATVDTQVGVIEPPSIAFGAAGVTAYTAQVRTYIHLKSSNALLGSLLSPLVSLDLPIVLDVVNGKGTLAELCTADLRDGSGNDRARITVDASIAHTCVGNMSAADRFSKSKACDENLSNMQLVSLVGGLLQVNNKLNITALPSNGSVTLKEGETGSVDNNLQIGTTVSNIVTQLASLLFGGTPSSSAPTAAQTLNLAQQLFNDTSGLCTANTTSCHTTRLNSVISRIQTTTASGGLLSGVVGGLTNLLNAVTGLLVGNGCTTGSGLLGLGPTSDNSCVSMIQTSLANSSLAASGGSISNELATVAGIVRPLLDTLGSSVLTPLLNNVLGVRLGVTDVNLIKLNCSGEARLVY